MNNLIGTLFFGGIGLAAVALLLILGKNAEKELNQKRGGSSK